MNFVKTHRNKFYFVGAVVGGAYALTFYLKQKLEEMAEDREEERISKSL